MGLFYEKISCVFFIGIFLFGCGIGKTINKQDYVIGKEKTVSVGSTMLSTIVGSSNWFDENLMDKGIKETLVYLGKSDNTIKIDYRQYYGDVYGWYIKDGFTQHLEYDLSNSNIIAYKNYRIKILDSNSSEITFIVLKH